MAIDTEPRPPAPPARKQIPLPAAVALLVVALAALFWFVLKPMLFPPAPTDAYNAPAPVPGAPVAPAPAPAPDAVPAPAPAPVSPPAGAASQLVPEAGEIVVSGAVKSVTPGTGQFTVEVSGIQLPGKGSIALSPPRDKVIILNSKTVIKSGGVVVAADTIAPGAAISAVGHNRGMGSTLVARRVVL